MKKIIATSVLLLFACTLAAQIPQAIKYQTVVRSSTGEILPNQYIGLQISIRDGSSSGFIEYQEQHFETTNQFGLVNLEIGTGTPILGTFSSIDWQTGLMFLEVELDPTGSSGFTSMGVTQLLSVPFALHAETSSQDGDWTINGIDLYTTTAGNVGIGTSTSGSGKLEVIGNGSNAIHAESSAGGGYAAGYFSATNPGTYGVRTQSGDYEALFAQTSSTDYSAIRAVGNIAGVFDGKVGIGTNDPQSQFQVNGDDGVIFSGTYGTGSIPVEGSGTRLMWYPGKGAFRVGYVDGTWWDDSYTGDHSMAFGFNTIASGLRSTATGSWTTASGENATAMGSTCTASATDAVAMGFHSDASGNQSIAMGSNPSASGLAAVSIGGATEATGDNATAMGYGTTAQSYRSFVIGCRNITSGTTDSWVDTDPIFVIGNGLFPAFSNAMTVLKNGKVGIGTTTPQTTLDVNGSINSQNNYMIDGNSVISIEGIRNISVGKGAGGNNTGNWATFVGDSAGYNNEAVTNTFIGSLAGYTNSIGERNTFLGAHTGYHTTTGVNNTFIGNSSGYENSTGSENTTVGAFAGSSITGSYGTFIGSYAGNTVWGDGNTFIGYEAGYFNLGDSNIYIGYKAGSNETGSNKLIIANGPTNDNILLYGDFVSGNLGIGTKELNHKLNINGHAVLKGTDSWDDPGDEANLFLGDPNHGLKGIYGGGLRFWTFDDPNHAIRFQDNTGTDFLTIKMVTGNVGIGTNEPQDHLDIYSNINDWNNLTLTNPNGGTNAGSGINFHDDGSGDAYIAYANHGNTNALSGPKSLTIQNGYGPIQIRTGFEEPLVLQSYGGGNVGIAVSDPLTPLHINQKSTALGIRFDYSETSNWHTYVDAPQDYNFAYNGTLKAFINDTDGSYNPMSDISLKKDIAVLPQVLEKVKQLQPCSYRFKDDNSEGNKSIGLIAQEVEPLFPEVVNEKDGVKGINYDAFAVIAIQAIREQQEMIEELKLRIEKLENK